MQDDDFGNDRPKSSEKLTSEEGDLGKPLESRKAASVYDFLYHDARRVGSFLAQFEAYGTPGSVKASEGVGRTQTNRQQGMGTIGVPAIFGGQAVYERSVAESDSDATEKTYDPFWRNATRLLDFLAEKNFIQRDILSSRLGQFVLASGSLVIIDPTFLKSAWDKPGFRQKLRDSFPIGAAAGKPKHNIKESPDFQIMLEVLKLIPHNVQCHIISTKYLVWASLNETALVGSATDLMLKNGALVPGQWNMLGVMDAFPDHRRQPGPDGKLIDYDEVVASHMVTPISSIVANLAPVARGLIGRPSQYYGVTPLLIFREVSEHGQVSDEII